MASTPGIRARHQRGCASHSGGRCNCTPAYEAWAFDKATVRHQKHCATRNGGPCDCKPQRGVKIRKTFTGKGALAEAKGWRIDATKGIKDKKLRAPSARTLREEVDEWLDGARAGTIRTITTPPREYKPGVIRQYEHALTKRILPRIGDRKLSTITHPDLLELVEQLRGEGVSDGMIRCAFSPLQTVFRRAVRLQRVPVNPARDLELPVAGARERAATPTQAVDLLGAMLKPLRPSAGFAKGPAVMATTAETAIWATAFYAGLRRGELQGLRVQDVDFDANCIRVERSWDPGQPRKGIAPGPIATKTPSGVRVVPMLEILRPYLEPLRGVDDPDALFFGSQPHVAFEPKNAYIKAQRAIAAEYQRRVDAAGGADVPPIAWFTLHECRHSFSTWLDHAGVSETRANRYMGHRNQGVPARYRHQLDDQAAKDASRLDEYLAGVAAGKVVELPRAATG